MEIACGSVGVEGVAKVPGSCLCGVAGVLLCEGIAALSVMLLSAKVAWLWCVCGHGL